MSESSKIAFSRKPYTVRYTDLDGNQKSIRRVPPPKLHNMFPTDVVTLNTKKNDDWDKGDSYKVKAINQKQPNTIQVEKEDGDYTFISFYDLSLEERIGNGRFDDPRDNPINNQYLVWP